MEIRRLNVFTMANTFRAPLTPPPPHIKHTSVWVSFALMQCVKYTERKKKNLSHGPENNSSLPLTCSYSTVQLSIRQY